MATRKSFKRPITKTSNPQPQNKKSKDWIIWAAWADRITFEDIKRETGKSEAEVIKIMRSNLKVRHLNYGDEGYILKASKT